MAQDILLSDHDLERLTGRKRSSWQKDRVKGVGIPFIRVGPRLVRYRQADVDQWLAERRTQNTSGRGSEAA